MKIAIFSDIHGNLPAFELMLKDMRCVDLYISLGDVVNYGPWSNECVQLLESLKNCIKLRGNHEEFFLSYHYAGENLLIKEFFNYCVKDFTEGENIKKYILSYTLDNFQLCHTIKNKYIFRNSKIHNLDNNYIIGHSHHQFKIESNGFVLYNPGSVGQNRKFINQISYMIYNTMEESFKFYNFIYDVDILINEMKRRNYPTICIDYYKNKRRLKL